jgi:hypothetical protein
LLALILRPDAFRNERLKIAATFAIVFIVVSSPVIVVLESPIQVNGASLVGANKVDSGDSSDNNFHPTSPVIRQVQSSLTPSEATLPSVLNIDGSGYTSQAALNSLSARPTNNLVNTNSFYDIVFVTSVPGAIKTIQVTFPAGTTVPSSASFNEAEGIGPGTVSKSGQTLTYTVTNAVNVPAGTKIRLEFANINNPLNPSANYKVTVTTRNAANAIIDGPTQSAAYTVKQIGTNVIANNAITNPKLADSSITSTKPNQNFMKRVTLTDSTAGNNVGWNPDGIKTQFSIKEIALSTDTSSFVSVFVQNFVAPFPNCGVVSISVPTFNIACNTAPANMAQLNYMVENLPANVS